MGRPKRISWEQRVNVFLAYRAGSSKVYPVAKRFGIARSTVSTIVREFEEMGFSSGPRASFSPALLRELQERHLQELWEQSAAFPGTHRVSRPGIPLVGVLNLTTARNEEEARKLVGVDPLPIPWELQWHLKGTAVERVIEEARSAARDLHQRNYKAWCDLRQELETACKLPERESRVSQDREPHLLPKLKELLYNGLLAPASQPQDPPSDWLKWGQAFNEPAVLTLNGEHVAVGSPEDHQRVKAGVAQFLSAKFREFRRCFAEVERLRGDLSLVQRVLGMTADDLKEQEVRRAICPACPYPEMREEVQEG